MPDLSLDLRYLRYAIVAAELRSLRKAAGALDVHQSTISRRIQLLENRLGFPLFTRSYGGIALTEAGRLFLADASRSALELRQAAEKATLAHRAETNLLRVGLGPGLVIGATQELLKAFGKVQPKVRVTIHEASAQDHFDSILRGAIDVCITEDEAVFPGCASEPLWTETPCVALPAQHRLARYETVSWEQLANERFLLSAKVAYVQQIRELLCARLPSSCDQVVMHDIGVEGVLRLVAIDFGLAFACSSIARQGMEGLVFRPIAGENNGVRLNAIWQRQNRTPALRRFLSLARSFSPE